MEKGNTTPMQSINRPCINPTYHQRVGAVLEILGFGRTAWSGFQWVHVRVAVV